MQWSDRQDSLRVSTFLNNDKDIRSFLIFSLLFINAPSLLCRVRCFPSTLNERPSINAAAFAWFFFTLGKVVW
jgi:hypothetical protein